MPNKCYKVECHRADRTTPISARQWNDFKKAIQEGCWIELALAGGDYIDFSLSGTWFDGFEDFECVDHNWEEINRRLGHRYYHICNPSAELILDTLCPSTPPYKPPCNSDPYPWINLNVEDEGYYFLGVTGINWQGTLLQFGISWGGGEWGFVGATAECKSQPFGFSDGGRRFPNSPDGTTILDARLPFLFTGLEVCTGTFHYVLTQYGWEEIEDNYTCNSEGSVAFYLFGNRKVCVDGQSVNRWYALGQSLSVYATDGQWGRINITSLLQTYIDTLRDSNYNSFAIIPGCAIAPFEMMQSGSKAAVISLRNSLGSISFTKEGGQWHARGERTRVRCPSIGLGNVMAKFKLPDSVGQLDMVYGNLVGELPTRI